jgi:phospholipid transport system substrate-binding protein
MSDSFLMYARICLTSIFLWVLSLQPGLAQDLSDPAQVVFQVTTDVLEACQQYRDEYDENPEAYFAAIEVALGDNINFQRMAYLVMDAAYYRASTAEQKAEFVEVFQKSLVRTYSKGLLGIDQADFAVMSVEGAEGAQTVTVKQELKSGSNEMDLDYSMRREPDGRWLLVNVVIDGINLGSTFRNQFAQSARKFDGDIDLVISSWSAED